MISKYWTSLGYPVNPIYYYINLHVLSLGDEKDRDLEEDITIITTNGGQEVNLILNTDDLILNAYPKEETEEKPFISKTLSITYISTRT